MIIDGFKTVQWSWGPSMRIRTTSSPRVEVERIRVSGLPLVIMRPGKGLATVELERWGIGGEEAHISECFQNRETIWTEWGIWRLVNVNQSHRPVSGGFGSLSWVD
jgi:hypothetical protein